MVQVSSAGRAQGVARKISEYVARRAARTQTRTSPSTWRDWRRTGARRPAGRATVGIGPPFVPFPVFRTSITWHDVEKVRQLCSRFVQRLNVLGVRFASSLAAAALDGHFEHPVRGLFVLSHGEALVSRTLQIVSQQPARVCRVRMLIQAYPSPGDLLRRRYRAGSWRPSSVRTRSC